MGQSPALLNQSRESYKLALEEGKNTQAHSRWFIIKWAESIYRSGVAFERLVVVDGGTGLANHRMEQGALSRHPDNLNYVA